MSKNLFNPRRASETSTSAGMILVLNELIAAKETGTDWDDTLLGLMECHWMVGQSEYRQEVLKDLFVEALEIQDSEAKAKLIEARYLVRFA